MTIFTYIVLGVLVLIFLGCIVYGLSWIQMGAWLRRFDIHLHKHLITNEDERKEEK